jgi:hypothetical protein
MPAPTRPHLWQGHYGNYDDSGHTELFTNPVECLKAMGWIERDGRPRDPGRSDLIYWDLSAMPVYENVEQAAHDKFDWFDYAWQAAWEHHRLPLMIWKYDNERRLDVHEQRALGLRP